jgi:hypothetical protein
VEAMRKTMVWGAHRGVVLAVHGEPDPTEVEWDGFVALCEVSEGTAILVVTNGGGPNAAQRAQIDRLAQWRDRPTAIVTESAIARGVATAILWTERNVRAFYPHQLDDAFEYIEIEAASRGELAGVLATMKDELSRR